MIVLTHSYKLSPFGPALQFVGGSKLISASSFWMRLAAELIPDLLIFSFFLSFFLSSFSSFSIFTCEKSLPLCVRTRVLCVSLFDYSHKLLPASVLSFETIATLLSKASLNQFHRVFSVLRFTRRE
jgi:hypothetical protein